MTNNIHPVVELLAARMESHPEEFEEGLSHRWGVWMSRLAPFVTEAERVLLRGPMMQSIHERVMDELMNGPERRAKEAEERELILTSALAQQQSVQQQLAAQQQAYQQQAYQNAMGQYQSQLGAHSQAQAVGLAGQSPNITPIASSGTGAILPVSAINQIKQALGIKK